MRELLYFERMVEGSLRKDLNMELRRKLILITKNSDVNYKIMVRLVPNKKRSNF